MKKLLFFLFIGTILSSCTSNTRAKRYGGTTEVTLEKNERFINITWKDNSLWVITEDTLNHIYYARENSSLGILEGKVIIKNQ